MLSARKIEKQERRATLERELGARIVALPTKQYGVILADAPWRFEPYSRETGMDRAADNHYPTMAVEDIAKLSVPAAKDAVLFLWATAPMLPEALQVMQAWGFKYKTNLVWKKPNIITGYWFRFRHELLLVGRRGKIPAPAPGEQWESVIEAPTSTHSTKPDRVYELIEAYYPTVPKLELFARRTRPGWNSWGNEVGEELGNGR